MTVTLDVARQKGRTALSRCKVTCLKKIPVAVSLLYTTRTSTGLAWYEDTILCRLPFAVSSILSSGVKLCRSGCPAVVKPFSMVVGDLGESLGAMRSPKCVAAERMFDQVLSIFGG